MTAGFMACCKEKPAVIDRRYSRKARVDSIEDVSNPLSHVLLSIKYARCKVAATSEK